MTLTLTYYEKLIKICKQVWQYLKVAQLLDIKGRPGKQMEEKTEKIMYLILFWENLKRHKNLFPRKSFVIS